MCLSFLDGTGNSVKRNSKSLFKLALRLIQMRNLLKVELFSLGSRLSLTVDRLAVTIGRNELK